MKQVEILYTQLKGELPKSTFERYVSGLPLPMQARNARLIRWQDKQANLLGKLLLKAGLSKLGHDPACLEQMQYTAFNRPFLLLNVDFNITHAGEYILCAIATDLQLGIDIEPIVPVDLDQFTAVMTRAQKQAIAASEDPARAFFDHWTIKESVVKAHGKGGGIPLLSTIEMNGNTAIYDAATWFFQPLDIDARYSAHLATGTPVNDIVLEYIDFG